MTEAEFLEKMGDWLKAKRDLFPLGDAEWTVLDVVLDDIREAFHTGVMPWSLDED